MDDFLDESVFGEDDDGHRHVHRRFYGAPQKKKSRAGSSEHEMHATTWLALVLVVLATVALLARPTTEAYSEVLRVNNAPFVVKGVAGRYTPENLALLRSWGANAIRTYHDAGEALQTILDLARAKGLVVVVGLGLSWKPATTTATDMAAETARILGVVDRFKTHPAVLCWNMANEREHGARTQQARMNVYVKDLNALARAIKATDPAHPVIASFIDFGTVRTPEMAVVAALKRQGIAFDAVGINCYGTHAKTLASRWPQFRLGKPFLVTELGWNPAYMGNPVVWSSAGEGITHEATSTEKAEVFREALASLEASKDCLGTMAFRWDQRSAHTEVGGQTLPTETWHMLFDPETSFRTDIAEELIKAWTGRYPPPRRAPRITSQVGIQYTHRENRKLTSKTWRGIEVATAKPNEIALGGTVNASVSAAGGSTITYRWQLRHHNTNDRSNPAAPTSRRGAVILASSTTEPRVTFPAPPQRGSYRLHVFLDDIEARTTAYASWPFRVN
jgi:hypothetical protein